MPQVRSRSGTFRFVSAELLEMDEDYSAEFAKRMAAEMGTTRRRNAAVLNVLGVLALAAVAAFAWMNGGQLRDEALGYDNLARVVANFDRVPAEITRSQVIVPGVGEARGVIPDVSEEYCASMSFKYRVADELYEARYYEFTGSPCFDRRPEAQAFVDGWPVGRKFDAYVNPQDPWQAYATANDDVGYREDTHDLAILWRRFALVCLALAGLVALRFAWGRRRAVVEARVAKQLDEDWAKVGRPAPEA